jgi:aminopeptidase N/puromycin-sensitive aminopeptidase
MQVFATASWARAAFAAFTTVLFLLTATSRNAEAQRLPDSVRPSHYKLTLTPDLNAATFSGDETIEVTLAEPTNAITLNAAEIAFQNVIVIDAGKQQKAVIALDKDKEQANFTFAEKLPAGNATLSIAFTGILNDQLRGFYLSKTARRNYAVTQFEATDARRAFPSFDEPAFKATFDISLVVDGSDTAISNSPIESDTPGPAAGKHTLKFATTPKMSSYLVAFLVGDFQCTAGEQDGVAIRVCSTPDKVALTPYGVDIAKYALHYYNNYFGIPYPLKKLDLVALPDFEAGAMENFGAITYRETALLIDPKTASIGAKKEVALVIAHEMAHQWFGDLVTMQWWDNLWLNEGFATWMENKPVAALHPEWNIEQTVVVDLNRTLDLDAQPTTRSIRARADTPDEINSMFDGIAYGKAGAVLLSVENYLGEETFRQGVHNYLKAHQYANATAEDFWGAQTAASHKPVDRIMESLVTQPGVPILTFGEPAGGSVSVAQKRFFLSPGKTPDPTQKWTIPVCIKIGANRQQCQVLAPTDSRLKTPPYPGLFFANAGGKGYYRSVYPRRVHNNLVGNAGPFLSPSERISLIGDEWAQVRANKASVGDFLDLANALKTDSNVEVLDSAFEGVAAVFEQVAGSAEEKAGLLGWIRATYSPELAKLGAPAETDSANTRELRALLFQVLGYFGKDPAIIEQSRQIAQNYLADPASVDSSLGLAALSIAARNGDAALFDALQKTAETSTNPELQVSSLRMLAQFEDPALVQRALDYSVSGKVRNQNTANQFAIELSIDKNRDQTWKYIKANWDNVKAQVSPRVTALVRSTGNFCSASEHDDVEQFFAAHKVPGSEVALKHTLERINGCIELRTLQEPNLKQWLAAQAKN